MQITDQENNTIKLIMRSPDIGNGWRNVSKACWTLVENFTKPELLEYVRSEDGSGIVKLSDRGAVLADYL